MTEKRFSDLPLGDAHLRETQASSEDIYQGKFLHLKKDIVTLPDGQQAVREYLIHPGAIAIVDGRHVLGTNLHRDRRAVVVHVAAQARAVHFRRQRVHLRVRRHVEHRPIRRHQRRTPQQRRRHTRHTKHRRPLKRIPTRVIDPLRLAQPQIGWRQVWCGLGAPLLRRNDVAPEGVGLVFDDGIGDLPKCPR